MSDDRQALPWSHYERFFYLLTCRENSFIALRKHFKKEHAAWKSSSSNLCKHLGVRFETFFWTMPSGTVQKYCSSFALLFFRPFIHSHKKRVYLENDQVNLTMWL